MPKKLKHNSQAIVEKHYESGKYGKLESYKNDLAKEMYQKLIMEFTKIMKSRKPCLLNLDKEKLI